MARTSLALVDAGLGDGEPVEGRLLVHAIERLLSAGIGITARAIGDAPGAATLTLGQWRVLMIACSTEGLRVGELAAHLGISVPSASRMIRRIEAQGLLTATRAREDRRVTVVRPTEAGQRLVHDVTARRQGLIASTLHSGTRAGDA